MSWTSIMLAVDAGPECEARTTLACRLAKAFEARIVGIAGSAPVALPLGDPYTGEAMIMMGEALAQFRDMAESEVQAALKRFHAVLTVEGVEGEWRGQAGYPADLIARQARCADVVMVGRRSPLVPTRAADPADVLLAIGRPILVVPPAPPRDPLGSPAVVAWTDSREAQRALAAALPLLKRAAGVTVLSVGRDGPPDEAVRASLFDVRDWLALHGVRSEAQARPARGRIAAEILSVAEEQSAGLVVAGGYGHARLRESVLGGVTQDLLADSPVCLLLSH